MKQTILNYVPNNPHLIAIEYHGVIITYSEYPNKWLFQLRGRDRETDSLQEARDIIDKPAPAEKVPFTRANVFVKKYTGDIPVKAVITSLAGVKYGEMRVWVTYLNAEGKGDRRECVALSHCFLDNEANQAKVTEATKLQTEVDALSKTIMGMMKTLKPYELPKNVE
jgi:hypothetical protein